MGMDTTREKMPLKGKHLNPNGVTRNGPQAEILTVMTQLVRLAPDVPVGMKIVLERFSKTQGLNWVLKGVNTALDVSSRAAMGY